MARCPYNGRGTPWARHLCTVRNLKPESASDLRNFHPWSRILSPSEPAHYQSSLESRHIRTQLYVCTSDTAVYLYKVPWSDSPSPPPTLTTTSPQGRSRILNPNTSNPKPHYSKPRIIPPRYPAPPPRPFHLDTSGNSKIYFAKKLFPGSGLAVE